MSIFLYATYAVFLTLALVKFGDSITLLQLCRARIRARVGREGVTYAGYNIVAAVVILPVTRHLTSNRDAVTAGLLCGPLAMLPAIIFFICMCAFFPGIGVETLPSEFMLKQMNVPIFEMTFQLMIFAALLESGTGAVHAVNERIASAYYQRNEEGEDLRKPVPVTVAGLILVGSIFLADRFGLVTLIAKGYRALSYLMIALYVVPLMTYGIWQLCKRARGDLLEVVQPKAAGLEVMMNADIARADRCPVSLADEYRLDCKTALISGRQALVRLPIAQRELDRARGLNTAGMVSGYRGSPLGSYDLELWKVAKLLDETRHYCQDPD